MGSDDKQRKQSTGPSWLVEVDAEKCSLCEVCVHCCPSGAIRTEPGEETLAIVFAPELCDGCGTCLERCPEKVMTLVKLEALPSREGTLVLAKGEMLQCSVCGAYFAPKSKLEAASHRRGDDAALIREQCPICRRTRMVVTFIDERRTEARGGHAEYKTGRSWHWKPVTEDDPDGPPCCEVLRKPPSQSPPAADTSSEDSPAES